MAAGAVVALPVYARNSERGVGARPSITVSSAVSSAAGPSSADELITRKLTAALQLVDIRVLDRLIATGDGIVSLAEAGLL